MKKIPLSIYVKNNGQHKTAEELGLTQGAISKALRGGRKIFIHANSSGKVQAVEIRPFPFFSNSKCQKKDAHDDN
ncbi:MAG: Cro/Cl family transcriptional regulator [Snodgrassella sp.]|nr:Cro/Cl family transcriptional regulator [Snodgrassella sp.]